MKRVYWVSKHSLTPLQAKELAECEVVKDPRPFSNAEQIVKRYHESKCDDMIVVAPLSVLQRLVALGIHPVWADMEECDATLGEFRIPRAGDSSAGRWMRHRRFLRIKNVSVEFDGPVGFRSRTAENPLSCDICTAPTGYDNINWYGDTICENCKTHEPPPRFSGRGLG